MKPYNSAYQSTSGQSLPEFAMVLPILIMVLMGIFDLGRAMYAGTVISNAAREGARAGVVSRTDNAPITQAVLATAIGLNPSAIHIGLPATPRSRGSSMTVTVTYTLSAITPMIGSFFGSSGNLVLINSSTMTSE